MKFIRSNTKQAILLVFILLTNAYVDAAENIKVNKIISKYSTSLNSNSKKKYSKVSRTSKKLMEIKHKMPFDQKIKNIFLGFLAAIVVKLIKSNDTIYSDASVGKIGSYSTEEHIIHIIKVAIDWCFEQTVVEYKLLKKDKQKENACNKEIIDELLSDKKALIHSNCQEEKIIQELDSNEYSTKNVIFGKFKGLFKDNSEFQNGYKDFKARQIKLKEDVKTLNKEIIPKLNNIKADLKAKKQEKTEKYTVVSTLLSGIFTNNICEGIEKCESITPFQHVKIILITGLSFLKCAAQAQIKELLWNKFYELITSIFTNLGYSLVGTILGAVFPGILVGFIIKFIFNNVGIISNIIKSLVGLKSDDEYEASEALFQGIGRLLGNILIAVTGFRRRKLKKYRKFDAPI